MKYYLLTPCCFLIYIIFLLLLFYIKKYEETLENTYFSLLSKLNLLGLIIEIICIELDFSGISKSSLIIIFVNKLYFAYLFFWISIFTKYFHLITYRNNYASDDEYISQNSKKNIFFFLETLLFLIIMFFAPYNIGTNNMSHRFNGSLAFFLYIYEILNTLYYFILIIKNYKHIREKKYFQIVVATIGTTIIIVLQMLYQDLYLQTAFYTILCYMLYFAIENPDLQELKKIEIANKEIRAISKEKNKFLEIMSHKIRTPLSIIKGCSELLKDENISKDAKENVDDIIKASNNLIEIIDSVINVTKASTSKIEIVNKNYSLKEILYELEKIAKTRLDSKPIEFVCYYEKNIPDILYGDQLRVKQCILNLLTNAIKYTDEGKIYFSVCAKNINNTCKLTISVNDTGRGIKKESLEKLFNKFERLDNEGTEIEGTGLGLALTKNLVELMGGTISCESVYKKGSNFVINIEQRIIKMVDDKKDIKETIEYLDFHQKKVLVVDDGVLSSKILKKKLEKYNLNVVTLQDPTLCINTIKENKFDLILLNDIMSKMTGKEIFSKLKKMDNFKTPVVVIKANAIMGTKEKYLNFGFNEYISKPIEDAELINILKKFLK